MFNLSGRLAVITGGTGALGLGVALGLQAQGARVVILGRSQSRLDEALLKLNEGSPESLGYICDVADECQLQRVCDDLLARFGRVDILVTCAAAAATSGKFEEIRFEAWRELLHVDLDGVFLACKVFGIPMIQQGFGRIVNMTSFHNIATYPYRVAYNAAKSGVEGLSRGLAVEWGHYGITVNTVAPGPIDTPRTNWFLEQDPNNKLGMLGRTPAKRLGEVPDLSATVAFLATDEAKHINGQQIVLDGGWTKNAWWGSHLNLS